MIYAQRNTSTFFPGSWISLFLFFLSRTILFICLVVAFRHDLALLHSCGTGSWIAGTLFVFLQAFTVGFLGFTISGSSYFRMRLISRISHWTWFRSAFLDLAIFLGLHPAVGNSRYVLILPFFYFLCWGDVSSSFTFGYISGVIRVGFLCFFLIWAFNHWDFPVTKKKIPWTNCIYLFAFCWILSCLLLCVESGTVLFCLDDTWTMVDWFCSCSDRLTRLFVSREYFGFGANNTPVFYLLGPQILVIHLSTNSAMLGKRKEEKKEKRKVWMETIHPYQLMRNEGHKKKPAAHYLRYYTTCLYTQHHNRYPAYAYAFAYNCLSIPASPVKSASPGCSGQPTTWVRMCH